MRVLFEIINDLIEQFPRTTKALFYGLMIYDVNLIFGLGRNTTLLKTTAPSVEQVITKLFTGNNAGDYFIGLSTLLGASLVIIAAIIQYHGNKQQTEYEKSRDQRKENMDYLGWLTLTSNDLYLHFLLTQSSLGVIENITKVDPSLKVGSTQSTIETIKKITPSTYTIDNDSRHLYIKLPKKISTFLHSKPDHYHKLITSLNKLKEEIGCRGMGLPCTDEQIAQTVKDTVVIWKNLIQKYSDGFELISPHIKAMRSKLENDGINMPYK